MRRYWIIAVSSFRLQASCTLGWSMALRRRATFALGSFDGRFGSGAPCWSAEDFELHYRALSQGHIVMIAPKVRVLRYGIRTMAQAWELWRRDAQGIGALLALMMRDGRRGTTLRFWWWVIGRMWLAAAIHAMLGQFPCGFTLACWMTRACADGYRSAPLPAADSNRTITRAEFRSAMDFSRYVSQRSR
jgi:hypothetical protein